MKTAVSMFSFAQDADLREKFALIRRAGYDGVEPVMKLLESHTGAGAPDRHRCAGDALAQRGRDLLGAAAPGQDLHVRTGINGGPGGQAVLAHRADRVQHLDRPRQPVHDRGARGHHRGVHAQGVGLGHLAQARKVLPRRL